MNNGELEQEEPMDRELAPEEAFKAFYILLMKVGPFSFPAKLLDEIPNDKQLISPSYNKETHYFTIAPVKPKRKRSIIRPRRRLIIPN